MSSSYILGVSSGIFGAAPQEEKGQYAGISQKIHYIITKGVQFNQIDLESITEFLEPQLKERVEAMKKLGIRFGFHGESGAFGGRYEAPIELESAIDDEYKRTHDRFILSLRKSGELGAEYFLLHSAESESFLRLRMALQPLALVDFWGRPLDKFLEENEEVLGWVAKQEFLFSLLRIGYALDAWTRGFMQQYGRPPTEEETINEAKKFIKRAVRSGDETYGAERAAYYIVAKYLEITKDPLWESIVKKNVEEYNERSKETGDSLINDDEITMDSQKFREADNYQLWVPAVAAKYVWGHLNPHPDTGLPDPKQILKQNKLVFSMETPMGPKGYEKLMRLSRPLHIYYLIKAVNCKYFSLAWDSEHILSCYIDPGKEIESLPEDAGSYLKVIHIGWPSPLQPAHLPIPLGSDQQLILYEWLFNLRKKGFKDGYIIFERGGGKDPIQKTVIVLREIIKYLEKDVPPDKLPLEFFGMSEGTSEYARQRVAVMEHAFDPLKGTLKVPEEEHTLLSTAAIKAGKRPEEWKKEELL